MPGTVEASDAHSPLKKKISTIPNLQKGKLGSGGEQLVKYPHPPSVSTGAISAQACLG